MIVNLRVSKTTHTARRYLEDRLTKIQKDELYELYNGDRSVVFLQDLDKHQEIDVQKTISESLALGILGYLGLRLTAYESEYDGQIVHDITPRPGKEKEKSSAGRANLPYHTDMAFLRFPQEEAHSFKAAAPDFLILAGVINTAGICTKLISIDEVTAKLGEETLSSLKEPEFSIRSPATVKGNRIAERIPLIAHHHLIHDILRFNDAILNSKDVVEGQTDRARQAIKELRIVLADQSLGEEVNIQPGTVLVFNNRKVVHGRGEILQGDIKPRRHFKRVYGQYIDTDMNLREARNPFLHLIG